VIREDAPPFRHFHGASRMPLPISSSGEHWFPLCPKATLHLVLVPAFLPPTLVRIVVHPSPPPLGYLKWICSNPFCRHRMCSPKRPFQLFLAPVLVESDRRIARCLFLIIGQLCPDFSPSAFSFDHSRGKAYLPSPGQGPEYAALQQFALWRQDVSPPPSSTPPSSAQEPSPSMKSTFLTPRGLKGVPSFGHPRGQLFEFAHELPGPPFPRWEDIGLVAFLPCILEVKFQREQSPPPFPLCIDILSLRILVQPSLTDDPRLRFRLPRLFEEGMLYIPLPAMTQV